jgi:hypothetical protein
MTREEIIAAIRAGKSFLKVNLQRINLQGADLRGINFRAANLQGADLQGANLQEANLLGTNLREADLRGADLRGANLLFMYAEGAKTAGIRLSWIPKKGDLVKIQFTVGGGITKDVPGVLLGDPNPDYIFDSIPVQIQGRTIRYGIGRMKPASRLDKIIQEELKKELKR